MARVLVTKYVVPLVTFNIGRFLPPPLIPFQAGTLVEKSPFTRLTSLTGTLTFDVAGTRYLADIATLPNKRVQFTWYREEK